MDINFYFDEFDKKPWFDFRRITYVPEPFWALTMSWAWFNLSVYGTITNLRTSTGKAAAALGKLKSWARFPGK